MTSSSPATSASWMRAAICTLSAAARISSSPAASTSTRRKSRPRSMRSRVCLKALLSAFRTPTLAKASRLPSSERLTPRWMNAPFSMRCREDWQNSSSQSASSSSTRCRATPWARCRRLCCGSASATSIQQRLTRLKGRPCRRRMTGPIPHSIRRRDRSDRKGKSSGSEQALPLLQTRIARDEVEEAAHLDGEIFAARIHREQPAREKRLLREQPFQPSRGEIVRNQPLWQEGEAHAFQTGIVHQSFIAALQDGCELYRFATALGVHRDDAVRMYKAVGEQRSALQIIERRRT